MRKYTTSKSVLVALLVALLSFSQLGCGKESVEKSVTKFVTAVRAARRVTTEQHEYGHLTDANYVARLKVFRQINVSSDKLGDALAKFTQIDETNRAQILVLLRELNADVNQLVQTGNLGIADPKSKAEYARYSLLAAGVLSSVELVIASSRKPIPVEGAKFPKVGE